MIFASKQTAQHNEPSIVLEDFRIAYRNYFDKALAVTHYLEYVDGNVYEWRQVPEQKDHARRVLARLARLT